MTLDELEQAFDKFDDEYLKFDLVEKKRSNRPDLHAFLLLDELVPGTKDMIACAEHDEFYLDVSLEDLAAVATEEIVCELHRCGVRFSGEYDCLAMFA